MTLCIKIETSEGESKGRGGGRGKYFHVQYKKGRGVRSSSK